MVPWAAATSAGRLPWPSLWLGCSWAGHGGPHDDDAGPRCPLRCHAADDGAGLPSSRHRHTSDGLCDDATGQHALAHGLPRHADWRAARHANWCAGPAGHAHGAATCRRHHPGGGDSHAGRYWCPTWHATERESRHAGYHLVGCPDSGYVRRNIQGPWLRSHFCELVPTWHLVGLFFSRRQCEVVGHQNRQVPQHTQWAQRPRGLCRVVLRRRSVGDRRCRWASHVMEPHRQEPGHVLRSRRAGPLCRLGAAPTLGRLWFSRWHCEALGYGGQHHLHARRAQRLCVLLGLESGR
mmetsp:Transcript_125499/g.401900  ORF Transcript_125499/g.401900 Transcript_125499/m.401900 type:complete len:294 (+) Transcript_125499:124-1005(+)